MTALTGFPSYPKGKIYEGYRVLGWRWETIDGVRVLRLPVFPDHSQSAVRRIAYYGSIAAGASVAGPLLGKNFEIVFVYHPPPTLGVPAILTKWLRDVPFVYEVQDLWPETLVATGAVNNQMIINSLSRLERFIYRQAAAITVISSGFKHHLIAKGVPAEKIHVIPNWADENTYHPVPRDAFLGEKYNLSGRFNVLYAGNIGLTQALHVVLQAAAILQDLLDVQFVFIGEGVDLPKLKEQAARQNLGNVRFIERQSAAKMPHFFAWADALLVHLRNDPLFHITIPSKTLAYLACGRPILCAVPGDGADVIRRAGAGLICPSEDPQALAQAVRALYALSPVEREAMGQAGRKAFLQNYTRQVLVDQYEMLFQDVARCQGGHRPLVSQDIIR